MYKIIFLAVMLFSLAPSITQASTDTTLANAADNCNSSAYNALKPERKKNGARELMDASSKGKKYAKWMKKYLNLLATCKSEAYLPDCKPASKIDDYQVKLNESKTKLEANMIKNYICSAPYVNKLASHNTPKAEIKAFVESKVKDSLGAANR